MIIYYHQYYNYVEKEEEEEEKGKGKSLTPEAKGRAIRDKPPRMKRGRRERGRTREWAGVKEGYERKGRKGEERERECVCVS